MYTQTFFKIKIAHYNKCAIIAYNIKPKMDINHAILYLNLYDILYEFHIFSLNH